MNNITGGYIVRKHFDDNVFPENLKLGSKFQFFNKNYSMSLFFTCAILYTSIKHTLLCLIKAIIVHQPGSIRCINQILKKN